MEPRSQIRRSRMARELESRGIRSPRVLEAMRTIPRERFVEEALSGKAYDDSALPLGDGQTISQPWIVARMSELAEPDGSGKVLEIGTGSGYQAAVLSSLFELVYTVERIQGLAERARRTIRSLGMQNVHLKIFDGTYGWSEFAPYRAILVTAGAPEVPGPLVEQLEEGGRLILPLAVPGKSGEGNQILFRFTRRGDRLEREEIGPCRFVPLKGRFGWPT